MKLQSLIILGLAFTTPPIRAALTLEAFHLLSYSQNSKNYCGSTQNTTKIKPNPEAINLCKNIPTIFTLPPANTKFGECACFSWSQGSTNAVACNCDSCAPLELSNFDRTCGYLVESCMQDGKQDVYEGGYIEKWGEGGRGYVSVHVKGAFKKPEMVVSCSNPTSVPPPSDQPVEEDDDDSMPDFEWDVPFDVLQIIEEIVYLNHTEDVKESLPKTFTPKEMDTWYAEIRKKHEQIARDHAKELKAFEKQQKKDEAATKKRMKAEWKKQEKEMKDASRASKKKAKAERAKYYKRFGGLDGLTDEEWILKIKEERRDSNFQASGQVSRDPFWEGLCKIGVRHVCVMIAKYSPAEPWYDPPK